MNTYILRYGEIALKGKNRSQFEQKLIQNCKRIEPLCTYKKLYGRILLFSANDLTNTLRFLFGIASFSKATPVSSEIDMLTAYIITELREKQFTTFRISTQRVNKLFPCSSIEINQRIGEVVAETLQKKVSLTHPDVDVGIELLDQAYVFFEKIPGPGGLPVASQGRILGIADTEDALVACMLLMKRGCAVYPVTFQKDVSPLWTRLFLYPPKQFITLEDLKLFAEEQHIRALAVPDTLSSIQRYDSSFFILRPLVGFQAKDIKNFLTFLCQKGDA